MAKIFLMAGGCRLGRGAAGRRFFWRLGVVGCRLGGLQVDRDRAILVPVPDLKNQVEAVLFTSDRPLSLGRMRELLPDAAEDALKLALDQLKSDYESTGRSFSLQEIAGGFQLLTRPEHDDVIGRFKKIESKRRLSRAALETMSIIAYKQPIKRADIESIRGVSSLDIIKGLMDMGLVRTTGREEAPGAPLLYGTTEKFLTLFGLKALEELPKPNEFKS